MVGSLEFDVYSNTYAALCKFIEAFVSNKASVAILSKYEKSLLTFRFVGSVLNPTLRHTKLVGHNLLGNVAAVRLVSMWVL